MQKHPYLARIPHQTRAVYFMILALIGYVLWLGLLLQLGWVTNQSSNRWAAFLLLLPLLPAGWIDLRMRLSWQPAYPTVSPPPPRLWQKLLQAEYGLYWWPALLTIPVWLWAAGLTGGIVGYWLFG